MNKNEDNKTVMHIASLVLGIISILTVLFWYISVPTSILAIIFGVKSVKKAGKGMGKAGMVLGIIGLSLCLFIFLGLTMLILISYFNI